MNPEEQRLSDLLKRAVPEPPMELSADRVTVRSTSQRAGRSRRPWLIPALAAVAAGAAAATVIALPSSASRPAASPQAASPAKPTIKAKPGKTPAAQALPTKVPTSVSPVTYSFGPATTDVTAAYVLDKAASAIGSQPAPDSGWLAGADWHTETQWTCGSGRVYTNNTWWDASGNGVGRNAGPTSGDPGCAPNSDAPYPIVGVGGPPASIGQKNYTWAQLDALPTDPSKLYPIVKADEQLPFSSTDPGAPASGQSDLIESIWGLVTTWPVPAKLQKALYEVAAKIPGVTVVGTYTDSLGRSGTALHVGMWTMVVDTSNGQILAMLQAATPASGTLSGSPASTSVYISQGWVSPKSSPLPIQNGTRGAPKDSPTASAASQP
jgi:hypothetical protein